MAEYTIECPKCGSTLVYEDEHIGMTVECASCGERFSLVAETENEEPTESEPALPPPPVPESPRLPERMKANRLVDGRTCPRCGQAILFGQDVHNCQTCGETLHESCWGNGGCPSPQCRTSLASLRDDGPPVGLRKEPMALKMSIPAAPPIGGGNSAGKADEGKVECKFCGEMIMRDARKCRHCGEYQDEKVRKAKTKKQKKYSSDYSDDDSLTAGEWVLGILCSGIACILSIIWICQGKKKGWKLLLLSLIVQVIGALIKAAAE
jgi:DNA-directed RNA polymerase subunit M/transcription elongation factor TFIIS